MKNYRETYVRKAEIAQLILLHRLYSLSGSQELIFQGGTALRWCYGGSRFSEDLDVVTPLGADVVRTKLNRMLKAVEIEMVPHFGPGALTLSDKSTRPETLKLFVDYRPAASWRRFPSNSNSKGSGMTAFRKRRTMFCRRFLPFPT